MVQSKFFERINSWNDYIIAQKSLNNKEKGNTFELLTKLYFQTTPLYNFYDNIWLLEEVPEKILEEIGLPRQDLGVDLIAQAGDQYHAIQCKYHSNKHQAVTYKEVSTFLSAIGQCDKITMGYICSSANVTSKNYEKIKKKPISKILADTWENLSEEFFKNINATLKRKPLKLELFKPREHQKDALNKAIEYFKNNNRGKLILPCGSGKSLTGFWITRELKSKNILIAVPSLSLIKQTLDVYLGQIVARKEKVKWLCICSDDGIGKSDDVTLLTEDVGVPCVTDPDYISSWLKNNKNEQKIIFSTYQSGKLIAEISKKQNLKFDLGIFDEAHKTVGSELSLFNHLLFDKNINIHKRVFMTATEKFYSGSKDDIVSMDDPDIYGDVFFKMTFKDAIENKLLTDYKIITLDIKESEISDFIIKNGLVSLSRKWKNKTDARSLASMIALRKLMEKYPINNAVSFHSSIEKAKRNSEIHPYITKNYGFSPITTYTVSGKQPTSLRNDIVRDFANTKKALITNARCLTEGVDVPNIDCIVFADPKKSKIDIVQALGRALRKKESKEWGYVVLPVVYDNNHEIDNESFNDVVSIIRGLAANDERIIEYFQTKTFSSGGGNRAEGESNVFEMIEENDLIDKLEIRVWEKLSKFNWMPFSEARSFVRLLNLSSYNKWKKWRSSNSKIINIPINCDSVYKSDGWVSWSDFLGHSYIATQKREYLYFKDARDFVRNLKLNSWKDWGVYCKSGKKPDNIPQSPNNVYENDGWISFGDWLGTGRVAYKNRSHISYNEAKKILKKLNISSSKNWKQYYNENEKIGNKIPKNPNLYYKNKGWVSWGDFLGHEYIATNLESIYLTIKLLFTLVSWAVNLLVNGTIYIKLVKFL